MKTFLESLRISETYADTADNDARGKKILSEIRLFDNTSNKSIANMALNDADGVIEEYGVEEGIDPDSGKPYVSIPFTITYDAYVRRDWEVDAYYFDGCEEDSPSIEQVLIESDAIDDFEEEAQTLGEKAINSYTDAYRVQGPYEITGLEFTDCTCDREDIEVNKVYHSEHGDSGVGSYEFWGMRGYDSQPSVETDSEVILPMTLEGYVVIEINDNAVLKESLNRNRRRRCTQ